MGAHLKLRQLNNDDYGDFLAMVIEVLKQGEDNSFTQLILDLCREVGASIQQILFTADLLSMDEAARVVRLASKSDPGFQMQLVAAVKTEIDKASSSLQGDDLTRLMEMLVHAVDANRLVPFLSKLCEHRDDRIRSKAVLLSGRVGRRLPKSSQLLRDADARVRANAVESMWGRTDKESIQFFKEASQDTHHRVAGNALLGLYQAGDIGAVQRITKMVGDSDIGRKLAGIWLMGKTQDPRFANYVQLVLAVSTGREKFALLKAGRMIKQRKDELLKRPQLRLEAIRSERGAGGRVRLTFLAFADGGRLCSPAEILATNAVVTDGEMRVDHFRWAAWGGHESLHAAFLIPVRMGVGENFATQLVSAMELGISGKRRSDQWAIQKYETANEQEGQNVAPLDFSPNVDVLRGEQLRSAQGAAASLSEGVEHLIPLFPAGVERKHLVVVLDPDLSADFRVPDGWEDRFRRFNVVPHVVACGDLADDACEGWQRLCTARQGIFMECRHAAELPQALRRLSLSLQSGFEVTYQLGRMLPSPGGPEPVSIEIYAELGCGKLNIDGDGQVIVTREAEQPAQ